MTDTPTLHERLAAGDAGPEIDARIWAALHDRDVRSDERGRLLARNRKPPHDECVALDGTGRLAWADPPYPRYSRSLDALLAATPEGWEVVGVARAWRGEERLYRAVLVNHAAGRVARGWSADMCGAWALAILDAAGKGGER